MSSLNRQIYVIDDDESVCRSLKILLGTYGFKVQTFTSANEFLSLVSNLRVGCLILDVHMPSMDGFELQQRLNGKGFRVPVIYISANKTLNFSEEYLKAAGAVGFLQKPFNDQALIKLIKIAFQKILISRNI